MSLRTISLFCAVALLVGSATVVSATPITVFDNEFNATWDIDTDGNGTWDLTGVASFAGNIAPGWKYRETGGTTCPQIWTATISGASPASGPYPLNNYPNAAGAGVVYSAGGWATGASTTEFSTVGGGSTYTVDWNSVPSVGGDVVQMTASVYQGSGTGGTLLASNVMGVNQSHTFSFAGTGGVVTLETKLTNASGTNNDTDFVLNYVKVTGDVVPEPSTIVLLGMSVLGLLAYAWRKRK